MKIFAGTDTRPKPLMNLLVYGDPGVGKTIFATSAYKHPDLREVLYFNIEGGDLSIRDRDIDSARPGRGDNGEKSGSVLEDLEGAAIAIASKKKGFEKYRTVVVDSASELQVQDLEEIVTQRGAKGDGMLQIQDYGKSTMRMRRTLRLLRDANVNVVFTSLARKTSHKKANGDTSVEIAPDLTARLAESIMGYVDFSWYMFAKEGASGQERGLLTCPQGPVRAKTRNPAFAKAIGAVVMNPDLGMLYDTLLSCTQKKESP